MSAPPERSVYEVFVPLHGAHQAANAAIATEAVESVLHGPFDPECRGRGVRRRSRIPGRVEMVSAEPTVILDGAHNPDAAAALGDALERIVHRVAGRRVAVLGMLAGRDPVRFLAALNDHFPLDLVVACDHAGATRGTRRRPSVAACESIGRTGRRWPTSDIAAGVTRAIDLGDESDLIVVTGSFRVVEEARRSPRCRLDPVAHVR